MGWTRLIRQKTTNFELEQKELNGVINPMMMNVFIAAGSGGDLTGGRPEMQVRESGNVSGNPPTFQLGTPFRDKPRVKLTSTCEHTAHELSTHNEHPLRNDQQDKTMMMKQQDVNETVVDPGHSKGGDKTIYVKHRGGLQALTEQNLRYLTIKNDDVHVVHGGRS